MLAGLVVLCLSALVGSPSEAHARVPTTAPSAPEARAADENTPMSGWTALNLATSRPSDGPAPFDAPNERDERDDSDDESPEDLELEALMGTPPSMPNRDLAGQTASPAPEGAGFDAFYARLLRPPEPSARV